jgi:hypothetical protein
VSKPDDTPDSPSRPGQARRTQQIPRNRDLPSAPPSGPPVKKSVQPKKSAGGPPQGKPQAVNPVDTARKAAPPSTADYSRTTVHVEPWSVTRLAFVVSVAMMIVAVVAVSIFWIVLNVTGVWGQINDSVTSVLSDDGGSFDIKDYLGFGRMFGLTLVLSAINVVLMTALATIGAHLYNLAAQLLGGLEVTFSDD